MDGGRAIGAVRSETSFNVELAFAQRASQSLVAFGQILGLSSREFELRLVEEARSNPALEFDEASVCLVCGGTDSCSCPSFAVSSAPGVRSADFDPRSQPQTRRDQLRSEAHLALSGDKARIAEFLVDNLTDQGLLEVEVKDAAVLFRVPESLVREVLALVQRLGGPGVAVRTVKESLLAQLESAPNGLKIHSVAETIMRDHSEALSRGQIRPIAKALGTGDSEVLEAVAYIRSHTKPHASLDDPVDAAPRGDYLFPDILVVRSQDQAELEVIVTEMRRFQLRSDGLSLDSLAAGPDATSFAAKYRQQAEFFIRCLQLRWASMLRIARFIVESQESFIREGERGLHSLTRRGVAKALGLHESTVGRVVSKKNVALPNGRVLPLSFFFQESLPVKTALREMIAREQSPLSDALLAQHLAQEGFSVSRRTVAKYRAEMHIPTYTLRA
jgi:RNA polymerase sigma-54 factor